MNREDADLSNEAEDVDLLGLADTVSAVHRLQVGLRVPDVVLNFVV